MCVLTYVPAGVDVPWEGLFNGGSANPDGHGWAVAKGDRLIIGKSMDLYTAAAEYEEALLDLPGAVSIFHSRIATAGTVNEYNVHPFYVGGTDHTIVAHNGILPQRWQPPWHSKTDLRSDTRLFADTMGHVIDNARGVPSRRIGQRLGSMIGTYNKLVFLSVKSGAPVVRIINSQMGVWVDGVWHSNYSFEARKPRYTPAKWEPKEDSNWVKDEETGIYKYVADKPWSSTEVSPRYQPVGWREPYDWSQEQHQECSLCKGMDIDPAGYCNDCSQCQDCDSLEVNCLCYIGERVGGQAVDEAQRWLEAREAADEAAALRAEEDEREWEAFIERQSNREVAQAEQAPACQAPRQIAATDNLSTDDLVRQAAAGSEFAKNLLAVRRASPTVVEFRSPVQSSQG